MVQGLASSREIVETWKVSFEIFFFFFFTRAQEREDPLLCVVSHTFSNFDKRGIFLLSRPYFCSWAKNWVNGGGEREEDLLKGDLFIGDTNLGVGNVVKGGSFIVVAPYFRSGGEFY